jgi:hypothetical protein
MIKFLDKVLESAKSSRYVSLKLERIMWRKLKYSARQNCCNVLHLHKDNVITQEVDHFILHNIYSHKALHLSYHMISIILCNLHFIMRYRQTNLKSALQQFCLGQAGGQKRGEN